MSLLKSDAVLRRELAAALPWPAYPRRVLEPVARPAVLGAAFDVLLRFELQRRFGPVPMAALAAETWLAQSGDVLMREFMAFVDEERAAFLSGQGDPLRFARTCLTLGQAEQALKSGTVWNPAAAAPLGDARQLLEWLALVPEDFPRPAALGAEFGPGSRQLGGAEVDLAYVGGVIDIKAVQDNRPSRLMRAQLCAYLQLHGKYGYWLAASPLGAAVPLLPPTAPRMAGLYFARHGELQLLEF